MAATRREKIPARLRSKVSPLLILAADPSFKVAGTIVIVIVAFGLCTLPGPVPGTHSALYYLLGPILSPAIPAVWYTLRPFTPYRGNPFTRGGSKPVDKSDPEVLRLVELFRSPEGKRALWRSAAKESAVLYALTIAFASIYRHSLNWDLDPSSVGFPIAFGAFVSTVWFGGDYLNWGMRTWIERESSQQNQ